MYVHLFLLLTLAIVPGCRTGSSGIGRLATVESNAYETIGAEYDKGARESDAGEKLIGQGRKSSEKGREQIRRGEKIVRDGNKLSQQSRDAYSAATNYVTTPDDPSEVQADTKELASILKQWGKGIDQVRKGNNTIADGTEKINKGEALMREGRSKMEYGKSLMRESERAYNTRKAGFQNYTE